MALHLLNDDCACGTHKYPGIAGMRTSIITPGGAKLRCAIEIRAFKHLIGPKILEQHFPGSEKVRGPEDMPLEHKASKYLNGRMETRDFAWLKYGLADDECKVVS